MTNPYKVLGVAENAGMDEIKKQYRALSRKYHPDANINNPQKDQAEERFKEIQAAYQQIVDEREKGIYGGYEQRSRSSYGPFDGFSTGTQDRSNSTSPYLQAALNYIRSRHYREALSALSNVQPEDRDGAWYYLSAIANSGMGNNVAAREQAERAVQMSPDNREYAELLYALQSGRQWYDSSMERYGSGLSMSNLCLYCACVNCCTGGCFCI